MSTVRASNLLDLIYKRGQAGVTRASVTIVFDNSDKSKAPVGFENLAEISVTRQIMLNGTSKYLICGHRSTQSAVQNLFQSVQLNINNPNFLIMQGKITKVLNMKPEEILSLIEEAAGTSMFEEKKEKAVKTMSKKEKRLDEIQDLLREEITPKLDKLREEKRTLLEFQKKSSELEILTKMLAAWEWTQLESKKSKASELITTKELELKEAVTGRGRMDRELNKMQKEVEEIHKRREKELAKGGKRQVLVNKQNELEREHSKLVAQKDIASGNLKEEETRISALQTTSEEFAAQLEEKNTQHKDLSDSYAKMKATYDTHMEDLKSSEDLLQTLVTGVSASAEDISSGFMGQLSTAQASVQTLVTEAERTKARIEHLKAELKEKEPKAKKAASEGTGLVGELQAAEKEVKQIEQELGKLEWDEEQESKLRDKKDEEEKAVRDLLEKRDAVKSNLAALEFEYSDPRPNFDRSSVRGLVANLIEIEPKHLDTATALEVCAGGRLYNVVVDDENVGSDLLKKGNLRKRVTIIPLSKINPNVASKNTMKTVQNLSAKTNLALSLVGYDKDVSKAMEFVFGNTLVCPDGDTAKLVTFHKEVRMRSVTLDGDVYDPSGTLSGGSRSSGTGVLTKVQKLKQVEHNLRNHRNALAKIEQEWNAAKSKMDRFKACKKKLDLKIHEVGLLKQRVEESNATRIVAEVQTIKTTIEELTASISDTDSKRKKAQSEIKRIEKEMEEFTNNRGSKLEQLKTSIKKKKTEAQKQTMAVKSLQREVQTAALELEQLTADASKNEKDLEEAKKGIKLSKKQLSHSATEVQELADQLIEIENQILDENKKLTSFDDELMALDTAIIDKKQEIVDGEILVKQFEGEFERLRKENKIVIEQFNKLESKHAWIQDEKLTFGKEGSPYYFAGHNMKDLQVKCLALEGEQKGMKKKINPLVLTMIDSVEKKEKDLMIMYRQVLKDKVKIEETVAKLDEYKKEALESCWQKVDVEFGNIFGELLPGNFCKLQPPEGMDITQGLEVKVRLGVVWKASLTELSGGQRSLIALSLILSLLHIKPAPMYILDEVDAALDLSHTENIGRLFKTRFSDSQFIVVSLKDGLFSNANVLFRTKFRDGTSLVERTTNRTTSSLYQTNKSTEEGSGSRRKKA